MRPETAVVWPDVPLLTGNEDAPDRVNIWDQPPRDPEPQPDGWSFLTPHTVFKSAQVLEPASSYASRNLEDWMAVPLYPGPAPQSSILSGVLFCYCASSSVVTSGSSLTCYIEGEPFQLDIGQHEHDRFVLHHRHWSLRGFGDTLREAEQDLWDRAQAIAPAYLNRSPEQQTAQARAFRTFLERVL